MVTRVVLLAMQFIGVLTNFTLASNYGSTGLYAHNFDPFFRLEVGDNVWTYDGEWQEWEIIEVREYQALSPNSPYSYFIDLNTHEMWSAETLFYDTYGREGHLILQTCIRNMGLDTWGRLFIIAIPVVSHERSML